MSFVGCNGSTRLRAFTLGGTAGQLQSRSDWGGQKCRAQITTRCSTDKPELLHGQKDHHHFECETYRADTRYYL